MISRMGWGIKWKGARMRKPSPKVDLPLLSSVVLNLMSVTYQPPGSGEGSQDTVYKNTPGIRAIQ